MEALKKQIPSVAFCLYFIKVLITNADYINVAMLAVLAVTVCFFEMKNQTKKVTDLEQHLNKFEKQFEERARDIDSLKSSVTGMKLGSSIRNAGTR